MRLYLELCLLISITFVVYPLQAQMCTLTDLPKIQDKCTAELDCTRQVHFDSTSWDCIRHVEYYEYDEAIGVTLDDDYNFIVNIKEPNNYDLNHIANFVYKLAMTDGNLTVIPEVVYRMPKLTEIEISNNLIEFVNFTTFLPMTHLTKINLTHNSISFTESNEESRVMIGRFSAVETIDLSYNSIIFLPNNCLSHFMQLQHLNLSHNQINSIDLLAVEGVLRLKTLDISHNQLLEIGNTFAMFINVQKLLINNNRITKLFNYTFLFLSKLEILNLSFNDIDAIENNTFQNLSNLKVLDLGHNKIKSISKHLFKSNSDLHFVSLRDNHIQFIETDAFKGKKITEFYVENNNLTGFIESGTFNGVLVNELNLSGQSITGLEDRAFENMIDLKQLNLSSNAINHVSPSAFSSLTSLDVLDLSHNHLEELTFDCYSLRKLSKFNAHHNNIGRINKNVFDNLVSVIELDLSYNIIRKIEPLAFSNMKNILVFIITGSVFVDTLNGTALDGMASLEKIKMAGTKTTHFKNESFSGLVSLTYINSSFGQLKVVDYNAFKGTGSLEILDLSHNLLDSFHVNVSTISKVQEIYLNHNFIKNVTDGTFSNLSLLLNLNMANNNIIQLGSEAFQSLSKLLYLDLSYNAEMKIFGNPFTNLSQLYKLSLNFVKTGITFENTSATIDDLQLQSCGINDINKMFVFNVQNVKFLNLCMNEIIFIDEHSFRDMPFLVSLDLSSNWIRHILPGSFLHTKSLSFLNLYGNNLRLLQFGAFDGIETLQELNLSRNALRNLNIKLLPTTAKLSVDDNIITNLNFSEILESGLSKLSIGGNKIPCHVLADLTVSKYSNKFNQIVTAKHINFYSENVNGISCLGESCETEIINIETNQIITLMKNAIDQISKSTQSIEANTNEMKELKTEARNVFNSMENLVKSNKELVDIKSYLMNLTNFMSESGSNISPEFLNVAGNE